MDGIVIHVPGAAEWSAEELAISLGGWRTSLGEIVLEKENERLFVESYHDFVTEHGEDEIELLHSLVEDPISYTVIWRGECERLLEQFLNAIPRNLDVVIDDDYGHFVLLEPNTQIANFMENRRKQSEEAYKSFRKRIEGMERKKRGID